MRVPKVPLLSIAVASVVAIVTLSGLSLTAPAHAQSETKRFLYLSTPDGAQRVGRADGAGILIYDIDNGHELVRRIDIPVFEEGLRGFAVSLINHAAYYSTTHRRVGAFDLESEEIIWEHAYPNGADRSSVTMDGSKVYVPTGWWYVGPDSGMLVLDARDGKMLNRIADTPRAHNSVVSLDGRRLYLGSETTLSIYDTADDEMSVRRRSFRSRSTRRRRSPTSACLITSDSTSLISPRERRSTACLPTTATSCTALTAWR